MSRQRANLGAEEAGVRPLKLRAHDARDLQALAPILQDALVPVSEVAYLPHERRFVMVANRFRWEGPAPETEPEPAPAGDARFENAGPQVGTGPLYERVNCGVCFDRVRHVRARGLDLAERDQILNLLTLWAEPGAVRLLFSGGAEIRLEVSQIRCHMEDLGQPWPTRWRPSHTLEEPDSDERG